MQWKQGYLMLLHFATLNVAHQALQWAASPPLDPSRSKAVWQMGGGAPRHPPPLPSLFYPGCRQQLNRNPPHAAGPHDLAIDDLSDRVDLKKIRPLAAAV